MDMAKVRKQVDLLGNQRALPPAVQAAISGQPRHSSDQSQYLPLPLVVCAGGTEYFLTEHRLAEEGVQISRSLFRPFYWEGTKDLMWLRIFLKRIVCLTRQSHDFDPSDSLMLTQKNTYHSFESILP